MNRRSLPPQAYTRDTLAKAYEWLKTQPEGVKSIATDADSLVTLFLQSRRSLTNQAPKSTQDFKNDLKNLAEGLKNFDAPEEPAPRVQAPSRAPIIPDVEPLLDLSQPQTMAGTAPVATPTAAAPTPTQRPRTTAEVFPEPPVQKVAPRTPRQPIAPPQGQHLKLDDRSEQILADTRQRLNLSQDSEALRMLLVLGHERLKQVLPPQN